MAGSTRARARAGADEPPESAVAPAAPARAKLFANGRSQAVRLPKEFRLPGAEVLVRRDGARLVLEPIDAKGWPLGLWDRLDALAKGLDDWERPPDAVPRPIRDERDLP
jgi:antitoxin VapB